MSVLTDKYLLVALRLLSKTYVGRADEQDLVDVVNAIQQELRKRQDERARRQQRSAD